MSDVRMVKLGDVLTFVGVPEKITEPAIEKYVTVQNNGRGAIRRVIKDGKSPVPFTGYRIKPGQFIYSRIDARNGAFAIIPEELDNFVVSKDFPIFEVQNHLVTPQYLLEFLKSGNIQKIIQNLSRGATNRQRIKEAEFLNFPFPLPSLEEQKRIVSILDKAKSIQEAREHQLAALDELASSLFQSVNRLSNTKVTLGEVISFSSHSIIPGAEHQNMPNIGPDCIEPNTGFLKGWRTIQEDSAISAKYLFTEGDILYSKIRPYLNKVSIADFTGLCSSEIYPLTVKKEIANTYYITYLLRSSIFLQYSELNSTGANIPRINKSNIEKFEFELPDLNIQNIFAEKIKKILHTRSFVQSSLEEYKLLLRSLQSSLFIH